MSAPRGLDVDAFTWTVREPRIVLGDAHGVTLELAAKTPSGGPLDVAAPTLSASTGRVGPPRRTGPGTWTATFTPPGEAFPHVAIVSATLETATGTAVGFVPLPLWGKGRTTVKTKPGSAVTVFIGNESFGPVTAGDAGEASVPIVVPPGPEHAVARSVDDVGNESQKVIDLDVPTFNRLAVVALDDVAAADGSGEARLLVFAVDKKGAPLYEAKLETKASAGAVSKEPVPLSPGMFELLFHPGKAARGTAKIDVSLVDAPGSTATAAVQLLSGRPARASLDTRTKVLTADDPRTVHVELRLFDEAGNAVPANAASVDVDFGRIDSVSPAGKDARSVAWVVPARLPAHEGALAATLTARASSGAVLGTRRISLLPGKPARLRFDPADAVVADGRSSVELHLRAVDAVGNPLVPTGAAMAVDGAAGQLVAATVDGTLYRARFVPAPADRAGFVEVRGAFGALSADTTVKTVPRPRARLLVGAGLEGASNYGALLQAGPELSLLVRLPGLGGAVHAGLSVSVLQSVAAPAHVDHRSFPLLVEAAWRPLLAPGLALHLGAGAGFVITDEVDDAGAADEQRSVLPGAAAQAVAGLAYRVGPGLLELDGRAGWGLTFPLAAVGAPVGAGVVLGYRFGI